MRWYGADLGLGKLNFVTSFSVMMFTFPPPSNKTSLIMLFPTCIWIITIWLFTFIIVTLILECSSITMATLSYDIILIIILGFYSFSFCHIYL